ncbi:unnamed protein product [Umbelopsis vinacea]
MIELVRDMNPINYKSRTYVIANTDVLSEVKARKLEGDRSAIEGKDAFLTRMLLHQFFVHRIPRLREVGQPLITVPFSVIKALLRSIWILLNMPDLIICNGPGSCISVCMMAYIPRDVYFILL